MIWVAGFAVVGIVLAIAAALVFREAARLSEDPPDAVFDPDDALGWVVQHLDDLVAATLTEGDVKRIIGFQMEFFRQRGVSHNGTREPVEVPALLTPEETVGFILERCAETGEAYIPEQVEAVMDCQLDYLRFIGAIGQQVDETGETAEGDPRV
jgi:hypothetical protein